jgi:hypothetical protein
MTNPIKKVVKRVKTVAREIRDVPTAYGTTLSAQQDYRGGVPGDKMRTQSNLNSASKNWDKQIAEVAKSILTGKKGTSSDTLNEYMKYKKGKKR